MKRSDLTEKLLDIKRNKEWTWKFVCEMIGGYSDVLIVGAILGQMKLTKQQRANAQELFGLSNVEAAMLNEVPMRGQGTPMPPTDPLIYRFYEMVLVNGSAWKALIEEEFGDGIMSAIDFDMTMQRVANPKGDRVQLTMSGKFLPGTMERLEMCPNTVSRRNNGIAANTVKGLCDGTARRLFEHPIIHVMTDQGFYRLPQFNGVISPPGLPLAPLYGRSNLPSL